MIHRVNTKCQSQFITQDEFESSWGLQLSSMENTNVGENVRKGNPRFSCVHRRGFIFSTMSRVIP